MKYDFGRTYTGTIEGNVIIFYNWFYFLMFRICLFKMFWKIQTLLIPNK